MTASTPPRERVCDGSYECPATVHIHGCFSDKGSCDHPDEHARVTASSPAAECPNCDGRGWNSVAVHASDCDGDCRQCPVQEQEQCGQCGGSGEIVAAFSPAAPDARTETLIADVRAFGSQLTRRQREQFEAALDDVWGDIEAREHNRYHAHANLSFCIQRREALEAELERLQDALTDIETGEWKRYPERERHGQTTVEWFARAVLAGEDTK